MAQRPANVYFTNPTAAASQANLIRLYDIERQKGEDLNRALATTAQTISARGAARDQLQSQRIAQDRELQTRTSEAEKARQSRDKETDKIISSNEKIAGINATAVGGATRDQAAQEAYKFALAAISSDDPPTDSEFNALAQGLDADRVGRLKGLLATSRRAADAAAAVGETLAKNWNKRLTKLPPGKTAAQVIDEFDKSGASKQAIFDSATGQFRGARSRARMDSPAIAPPTAVEQLDKIRGRIPGGVRPGASAAPAGIIPDVAGDALADPFGLPPTAPMPFMRASEVIGTDLPALRPSTMWQQPVAPPITGSMFQQPLAPWANSSMFQQPMAPPAPIRAAPLDPGMQQWAFPVPPELPPMEYLPTDIPPRPSQLPYLGTDFVPARRLAPPRF